MNDQEAFDDLSFYTLSLGDAEFIHQHIVDAFAAQHADEHSKPIKVAFALAGLFLHHELGYSGRQVQLAHMALVPHKACLPVFVSPAFRGNLTIHDALQQPPGPERDVMIGRWSASVWEAWSGSRGQIVEWLKRDLGI